MSGRAGVIIVMTDNHNSPTSHNRHATPVVQPHSLINLSYVALAQDPAKVDIARGTAGSLLRALYGIGLPGFSFCACLTWWGEVIRMERAGGYLRGLEQHVASVLGESSELGGPLRWETAIAIQTSEPRSLGRGKQRVGYIGALGIYLGAILLSLLIFVALTRGHAFAAHGGLLKAALCAYAAALLGSWCLVIRTLVRDIQAAGHYAVDVSAVQPGTVRRPITAPASDDS